MKTGNFGVGDEKEGLALKTTSAGVCGVSTCREVSWPALVFHVAPAGQLPL